MKADKNKRKPRKAKELTERERSFVRCYAAGGGKGSGPRCYVAAGYKDQGPAATRTAVYRLLRKPHIIDALEDARLHVAREVNATQTRVLQEIVAVALSTPANYLDRETGQPIPLHECSEMAQAAVIGYTHREVENMETGAVYRTFELKLQPKGPQLKQLAEIVQLTQLPDKPNEEKAAHEYSDTELQSFISHRRANRR